MKKIKRLCLFILITLLLLTTGIYKIKADSGFDASYDSGSSYSSSYDSYSSSDYSSSYSSSDYSYSGSYSGSSKGDFDFKKMKEFLLDIKIIVLIIYLLVVVLSIVIINKKAKKKRKHLSNSLSFIIYVIVSLIVMPSIIYRFDYLVLIGYLFFVLSMLLTIAATIIGVGVTIYGLLYFIYSITLGQIVNIFKKIKERNYYFYNSNYKELNTKELRERLFGIYKDIQLAWSKNNIEPVRNILTDELFNTYQFQIDSMITTKQRNVMENIKFKKMCVTNHSIIDNNETITVNMMVTCRDYIISTRGKKEKVIRGKKRYKLEYIYEMTFVRNTINKMQYCPNCGSKLTKANSEKCVHCGGIIVHDNLNYVLSKKKMLFQRRRKF